MAREDQEQGVGGISRRGFFKGVGAGAVATGLLREVQEHAGVASAQNRTTAGPGEVTFTLNVNGENRSVTAEPRVTLLDALRRYHQDVTTGKFPEDVHGITMDPAQLEKLRAQLRA